MNKRRELTERARLLAALARAIQETADTMPMAEVTRKSASVNASLRLLFEKQDTRDAKVALLLRALETSASGPRETRGNHVAATIDAFLPEWFAKVSTRRDGPKLIDAALGAVPVGRKRWRWPPVVMLLAACGVTITAPELAVVNTRRKRP